MPLILAVCDAALHGNPLAIFMVAGPVALVLISFACRPAGRRA